MTRYIRCFDKYSDSYIEEYKLPINLNLNDLINHLGSRVSNDPMLYYCYKIYENEKDFYEKNFHIILNFENYDYFLECDA